MRLGLNFHIENKDDNNVYLIGVQEFDYTHDEFKARFGSFLSYSELNRFIDSGEDNDKVVIVKYIGDIRIYFYKLVDNSE